jgi:hypothetical protein
MALLPLFALPSCILPATSHSNPPCRQGNRAGFNKLGPGCLGRRAPAESSRVPASAPHPHPPFIGWPGAGRQAPVRVAQPTSLGRRDPARMRRLAIIGCDVHALGASSNDKASRLLRGSDRTRRTPHLLRMQRIAVDCAPTRTRDTRATQACPGWLRHRARRGQGRRGAPAQFASSSNSSSSGAATPPPAPRPHPHLYLPSKPSRPRPSSCASTSSAI